MDNYSLAAAVPGKSVAKQEVSKPYQPKYSRPHLIIPQDDSDWALQQKPSVLKLWVECWRSDPYGSRWMQLTTSLGKSAFSQAKKILYQEGLFVFRPQASIIDGRQTVCWEVKNLHGSRVADFWQQHNGLDSKLASTHTVFKSTSMDSKTTYAELESTYADSISPQTIEKSRVSEALSISSVTSQNPPQVPPAQPSEEEEKILQEKEEESSQEGDVRGCLSSPQEEVDTRKEDSVEELSGSGGAAACVAQSAPAIADDDSFLQWVKREYLPTTKDYQAGTIRNLDRYALKVIANDGDVLRHDWLKSKQAATWNAYCQDIEVKVRAKAAEWVAAGHQITVYYQLEDGLPAVAIDIHTHVSGPDFLLLPLDHRQQTELPPVAQSLMELLRLRPGRQRKLNNFEAWARLGDFQVDSYWIDFFVAAWGDSAFHQQIRRIISVYPALGLIIEGDRLVEDF